MSFKLSEREIKVALVTAVLTMVVSVLMLESKGYIKHLNEADKAVIGEFRLVEIGPDSPQKVSNKPANKEAFCADGYLMMRPEKNQSGKPVAGLLVDEKNRPILCSTELPSPKNL